MTGALRGPAGSGDWDGSARPGAGAGGPGVRGEEVGNGDSLATPGSRDPGLSGAAGQGVDSGDALATSASDDPGVVDVEDGSGRSGDVDDGFESEDDSFYDDGEYRGRPFWARTSTLVVFVVVLFVLSGAVTAWLRISDLEQQVTDLEAQTFAAEEARQAALVLAQDLATYDYRDLGGNFRHVSAAATPRFAEQLEQLAAELGPELQQNRAVATATARSAGVVRSDQGKAVVVVLIDQSVTNARTPSPRVERSRMELTLLWQGGVWRLDQAGEL